MGDDFIDYLEGHLLWPTGLLADWANEWINRISDCLIYLLTIWLNDFGGCLTLLSDYEDWLTFWLSNLLTGWLSLGPTDWLIGFGSWLSFLSDWLTEWVNGMKVVSTFFQIAHLSENYYVTISEDSQVSSPSPPLITLRVGIFIPLPFANPSQSLFAICKFDEIEHPSG